MGEGEGGVGGEGEGVGEGEGGVGGEGEGVGEGEGGVGEGEGEGEGEGGGEGVGEGEGGGEGGGEGEGEGGGEGEGVGEGKEVVGGDASEESVGGESVVGVLLCCWGDCWSVSGECIEEERLFFSFFIFSRSAQALPFSVIFFFLKRWR